MAAQNPLPAVYHYPPEFMAQLMPEIIRAHVARGGLLARRRAPRNAVKDHRAGQCRRPRTLAGLAYPLHGRLLPRRGWPQWIIRGWLALESGSEPLLIARTEGNPLFLEDSGRTLVETGALTGSRGAYRFVKPLDGVAMPAHRPGDPRGAHRSARGRGQAAAPGRGPSPNREACVPLSHTVTSASASSTGNPQQARKHLTTATTKYCRRKRADQVIE